MRYAVTGATGFIGGHLVQHLLDSGDNVTAVVRDPQRARDLSAIGADVVAGDVTSFSSLFDAFQAADAVFHLAGWYRIGVSDTDAAWAVNVQGTRNVLVAARDAGVQRVVHTSTVAVNSDTRGQTRDESYAFAGRHLSVYDHTKARAHAIAESFQDEGMDVVIVMPGGVYGPGDTSQIGQMIEGTAHGRRVTAPSGLRLCMAHVDDVVVGHVLAMDKGTGGESYMLTGPSTSLVEVLRIVAEFSGGPRPIVLPAAVVGASARLVSVAGARLPLPARYSAEALRVSGASYLGTSEKAQSELGWLPRDLYTGLAQTVAALD